MLAVSQEKPGEFSRGFKKKKNARRMCIWKAIPHSILSLNIVFRQKTTYLEDGKIHLVLSTVNMSITLREGLTDCDSHLHQVQDSCLQLSLDWWQSQDPKRSLSRSRSHFLFTDLFTILKMVCWATSTWGPWDWLSIPTSQHHAVGYGTPT